VKARPYLREVLVKSTRRPRTGLFFRAESFHNVATAIEQADAEPTPAPPVIDSYGGRSLHEQSHGESFLALMLHRFGGRGMTEHYAVTREFLANPARMLERLFAADEDDE